MRAWTVDADRPAVGLEITSVVPDGPAAAAGLRPGDIITEIDGAPATTTERLVLTSLRGAPGDTVTLTFRRGDGTQETDLVLAAPDEGRRR